MAEKKILVVDDEPDILQTLETLLTSEGFLVRKASGGRQAIELCQSEPPDLVLTDIRMPGMDGLELIKHLKHLDREIEIIVLTGFASIDNAIEALHDGGAYDFLRKPLENLDTFFHTIHQALEKRRLRIKNRELLEEIRAHHDHLEKLVSERTVELSRANERLQQEIVEHRRTAQKLRHAKDAAETANYAKSAFMANVTHELRTPLNSILGFSGILQDADNLTALQKSHLVHMEGSGKRLLTLINDILDVSHLEAQTIELHESTFCFAEFLSSIVQTIRGHAHQKGLVFHDEIEAELPRIVRGDERRLRQVLLNVLNNAVRFTEQGSVTFRLIDCAPSQSALSNRHSLIGTPPSISHKIRFEVEDTGIGIPGDQLEKIFLPFKQVAEYLQKKDGGAGLGLAVSRRLIRLMGGDLHVESTLGKGSIFWCELELPEIVRPIEQAGGVDPAETPPVMEREPIIPPSQAELSGLYELVLEGDIFEVRERIEEIDRNNPELRPFIAEARKLAKELKVLEIQQFLEQYLHD